MQTVRKQLWVQIATIKNSKFETFITQVNSISEVEQFLAVYEDAKATHNCYAYIIGFKEQIVRFSDDGEPSHSAGFPLLKVLQEKQLTNVVVLVRRYFHPPKLGVGGLMRGYQQGLLTYLTTSQLLQIVPSKEYEIVVPVTLLNFIYHWQKIYHFVILKQTNDEQKVVFLVALANSNFELPYHPEIKVTLIKDSFLIAEN